MQLAPTRASAIDFAFNSAINGAILTFGGVSTKTVINFSADKSFPGVLGLKSPDRAYRHPVTC